MELRAFGAYVRRLRERAGFTQASLVDALHGEVSLRTIGRWENGKNEPYVSELAPVMDRLQGSILRAVLLVLSDTASEGDAARMADRADSDLSTEELTFFAELSPARRNLLRQFIEAEKVSA